MPDCERVSGHVCFNPRSHEGSDRFYRLRLTIFHVSIHAPTKGATSIYPAILSVCYVSIHAPTKGATAISAKNSFQFSAEINKLSFYILNFPLFPSPLFSTFHFICAYFRVRIPRIFMCASYSHSYIITKYIICCNSTIGTFFCFIYKSAPFL